MIIPHPLLGPRDSAEFTYLGDASLIERPDWQAENADHAFYDYQYLRDNPAGVHKELWFHEQGDRSWLVVPVTPSLMKYSKCALPATSPWRRPMRVGDGLTDRSERLRFSFNGRSMEGHRGDTLASALLANGRRFVGRSFKYHRPRGIYSAGPEEPNALLTIGEGAASTPNTRATVVELEDGLISRSQNHRGSLEWDRLAVNDALSPFLSAGFYYKTFMWPQSFWEKLYEPTIRAAAGLGALSGDEDPARYDKAFCTPISW